MKTYKTYEDGLNDAWELARNVISSPNSENKSFTWVRKNVIGSDVALFDIIRNYSVSEIIEEIKKYEEIKVGDEVEVECYGLIGVVIKEYDEDTKDQVVAILWSDGSTTPRVEKKIITKTGRNILKEIRIKKNKSED